MDKRTHIIALVVTKAKSSSEDNDEETFKTKDLLLLDR